MVIMYYRKIREQNIKDIVENQYTIVAKKYNISVEEVKNVIYEWMQKRPLKILKYFKDKKLCELIKEYKKMGLNIIIYSDYPTEEKLIALKIDYNKAYDSTHTKIRVLKPSPKGLQYILESNNLNTEEVLFIGDRDSKDGECARQCKIDYIILPKLFRNSKYKQIKQKVGEK